MIKDEAASIRSILEAAKPFVDTCTVVDTGSTDGTQDIVREVMADRTEDLFLTQEKFVSYAETRNRALTIDAVRHKAEFQIMLSGDEILKGGDELRAYLQQHHNSNVDCFRINLVLDGETRFTTPRVFRAYGTGSLWKYQDDGLGVHEYPANPDPAAPVETIPNVTIEHVVSDPEKRFANIWENHIPLLKARLEEEPNNPRALIFLAASYESLLPLMDEGERITCAMKVMSLYLRRLLLPINNDAERNFLRLRYLTNARMTGVYTDGEIFARCKELQLDDPHRPETALLLLHAGAAAKIPVTQAYQLAVHAAKVATEANSIESQSPVSTSCEWKAHHAAASIAKRQAIRYPDWKSDDGLSWADLVHKHAAAGLAAGGGVYLFNQITEEIDMSVPLAITEAARSATEV